jgi:hypothetical protein
VVGSVRQLAALLFSTTAQGRMRGSQALSLLVLQLQLLWPAPPLLLLLLLAQTLAMLRQTGCSLQKSTRQWISSCGRLWLITLKAWL